MWRRTFPALLVVLAAAGSAQAVKCPLRIVSGAGGTDGIAITFRNETKLPIRRLVFRCMAAPSGRKTESGTCVERNALFYPGG